MQKEEKQKKNGLKVLQASLRSKELIEELQAKFSSEGQGRVSQQDVLDAIVAIAKKDLKSIKINRLWTLKGAIDQLRKSQGELFLKPLTTEIAGAAVKFINTCAKETDSALSDRGAAVSD